MLPELKLFLLVDEFKELVPSHAEDLVKPAEHETFEVLIWDAKDWGTVALNFTMPIEYVF